jgi:prepilin-type N-terminal cleavage/methylation domain-containing protein
MTATTPRDPARNDAGFTLIELMISVGILLTISAFMMRGTLDMTNLNTKQSNLSEMHAGIRNATSLLQQEVGQAGRLAFPAAVTAPNAIATGDQWVIVTPSVTSMFVGMRLEIVGKSPVPTTDVEEIVTVTAVDPGNSRIRAMFTFDYVAGARIMPAGGFAEGIIPTTAANGSTASKLKIVGDINGDGTIMYVEYTCDWVTGRLYRNMMAYDAASKPALSVEQVLLDNLLPNPPDPGGVARPCFTYDQRTIKTHTYVINVAIMTTVRTDERDKTTGQFQTVTKALLNVAPRNVFNVWQVASLTYVNRIEPLPASVLALLP